MDVDYSLSVTQKRVGDFVESQKAATIRAYSGAIKRLIFQIDSNRYSQPGVEAARRLIRRYEARIEELSRSMVSA